MTPEQLEKIIRKMWQAFPRKAVPSGDREKVWSRIQSHIWASKPIAHNPRSNRFGFMFVRNVWVQAFVTIIIVLMAISIVRGAASATPGETLYPVKKAAEKVEKVLATNDEAKVNVNIKHAKRRLQEVQILVAENRDTSVVAETLNQLTNTTLDAVSASESKPELQDKIVELANHEEEILGNVQNQAEEEVKQVIQEAIIATKESVNKLQPTDGDKVEGATVTSSEPSADLQATSTPAKTQPKGTTNSSQVDPNEGVLQSGIQIHGVIRLGE